MPSITKPKKQNKERTEQNVNTEWNIRKEDRKSSRNDKRDKLAEKPIQYDPLKNKLHISSRPSS